MVCRAPWATVGGRFGDGVSERRTSCRTSLTRGKTRRGCRPSSRRRSPPVDRKDHHRLAEQSVSPGRTNLHTFIALTCRHQSSGCWYAELGFLRRRPGSQRSHVKSTIVTAGRHSPLRVALTRRCSRQWAQERPRYPTTAPALARARRRTPARRTRRNRDRWPRSPAGSRSC